MAENPVFTRETLLLLVSISCILFVFFLLTQRKTIFFYLLVLYPKRPAGSAFDWIVLESKLKEILHSLKAFISDREKTAGFNTDDWTTVLLVYGGCCTQSKPNKKYYNIKWRFNKEKPNWSFGKAFCKETLIYERSFQFSSYLALRERGRGGRRVGKLASNECL